LHRCGTQHTSMCKTCEEMMYARLDINDAEESIASSMDIDPEFQLNETIPIAGKDLTIAQLKDLNKMLKKDVKRLNLKMVELRKTRNRMTILQSQMNRPMSPYMRKEKQRLIYTLRRIKLPTLREQIQKLRKDIREEKDLLDRGMQRYVKKLNK